MPFSREASSGAGGERKSVVFSRFCPDGAFTNLFFRAGIWDFSPLQRGFSGIFLKRVVKIGFFLMFQRRLK